MRVAVLTEWFPKDSTSHEGIFIADQVKALRDRGLDVEVIYVPPARGPRALRYARFALEATNLFKARNKVKPFDLIHSHEAFPAGWLGNQLAHWHAIPSVITQHCWPLPCSNDWPKDETDHRWLEGQTSQRALWQADEVICVSDYLQRRLERGTVVPLIVDMRFAKMPAIHTNWLGPRRFLYVGRFCHRKGTDAILAALKIGLPDGCEFVLMGDGPMLGQVAGSVYGMPGVKVIPPGGREEVLRWMDWCDVFVYPSRGEGFGVAGIEAAILGRPVICGQRTATAEILGDSGNPVEVNGWEVHDAMFGQLKHPNRSELFRRFNSDAVASQIEAIYDLALDKKLLNNDLARCMRASE